MPQEYSPAPEVEEVARELINKEHTDLSSVRIDYVFIVESPVVNGKAQWGRAKKITGLNAWLASASKDVAEPEDFFVIEIVRPVWLQLNEKERKALVDHELTHCDVNDENGKTKLSIRPHDLEEFNSIVRKYGLWRADVVLFAEAAGIKQEGLFEDKAAERKATIALGGTS